MYSLPADSTPLLSAKARGRKKIQTIVKQTIVKRTCGFAGPSARALIISYLLNPLQIPFYPAFAELLAFSSF